MILWPSPKRPPTRVNFQIVGVRLVGDVVRITLDGALLRTHRARHDRSKEFVLWLSATGNQKGTRGCRTR